LRGNGRADTIAQVVTWGELAAAEPELARDGAGLLYQFGVGLGFLATVRRDGGPRVRPMCPLLAGGGLFAFIIPSPKQHDLLRDGRYALHSFPSPENEDAFSVTGVAVAVADAARRGALASWTARCSRARGGTGIRRPSTRCGRAGPRDRDRTGSAASPARSSPMRAAPIIIGSARTEVGLPAGMAILRAGGAAIDAVEAAVRCCEDNEDDHYVGTGGLPNARGEVELDAAVMVGSTRHFGAVAALKGFPHPISVARAVMDRLPQHCLLVGDGAATFADEQGFERAELLTDEAARLYREALEPAAGAGSVGTPESDAYRTAARELVARLAPHDGAWGTVNVLALDEGGEMVAGVSTSGFPWKYPGRVGDSPLPGAGIYCDSRHGAAACTGRGEMAMRVVGARLVVDALAAGVAPVDACRRMVLEASTLDDPFSSDVRVLCLTPDGRHGGAARRPGATYGVLTAASDAVELVEAAVP